MFKIFISKSQGKEYSEQQAKEILDHLKISIYSDTVNIQGYCTYKIHKELYNVHATKYDTYSLIMNECDVSKSDALYISNFNGANEGCGTPYSELIQSKNEIICFDNGYFFHYQKDINKPTDDYKINNISGIVGDTRQEWKINYTFSGNLKKRMRISLIGFHLAERIWKEI